MRHEAEVRGIDAHVVERRAGENRVVAVAGHPVLQQPMRENDVGAGDLRPAADRQLEELAVVADRLQAQTVDAATGVARAAVVGGELALLRAKARKRGLQDLEEPRRRQDVAVGADGEYRVALDRLDLERRREMPNNLLQQLRAERWPVFDLGRR